MSDTEQSKKRKLEEIAAAATPSESTPAASTTSESANVGESDNSIIALQLAKDKQRILKLLEPFSREQLIAILASAASQFASIADEIKAVASTDVAHRKIFVRGLAWETTSESLKSAFSSFGLVEEAAVIYDKVTTKSKGYGFVTFTDMDAATAAVEQQTVDIDGRRAACNLAALRATADEHHGAVAHRPIGAPAAANPHAMYAPAAATQMYGQAPQHTHIAPSSSSYSDESERKLFVRGLSWNTTDDLFYAEFSKFGELEEAMIARDRATGKSKGFGFITFRHKASADLALQQPQKIIDGRTTTCNLASQGGARAGGNNAMGGYGSMAPVMPAAVQSYAMPMYAAMPGQYAPPQMQQQQQQQAPVQYGAYPGMAPADPYQSYGAVAPQYYAPPGQQPPPRS